MTLVVGFHLGSYVFIAADTRLSSYPNGRLRYRDDEEKIQKTALGIISGAGLADLLDPVKDRLADNQIEHTDRIIDVIKEELAEVHRYPWASQARVQEALTTTAWMFSYIGNGELINPSPGAPILRLAMTVPEEGYKFALVKPNTSWLFPPTGTTPEQQEKWYRFCQDNVRALTKPEDVSENIAHHIAVTTELMREVSDANEGVAATFQVGIHALPFHIFISGIIGDGRPFAWLDVDSETPT